MGHTLGAWTWLRQLSPVLCGKGDVWGGREGLRRCHDSSCGGSASLEEAWEEWSWKNRLNSASPELGDTGARAGPGWVVPAAAGWVCLLVRSWG